MCPKCEKSVKSTNCLVKHINACKISITLLYYHLSNLIQILEYNLINYVEFLSDNNKKNICLKILKNGKKKIKPANINNNEEDIKQVDIDKQRPATPN